MKALRVLKYVGFGILGVGFVFLSIYVTMCLWNALIPSLFHGPVLGFWQTAGLFILSKILLTGVAPGGRGHGHGPRREWHRKYNEKYHNRCCENSEESAVPQA
jgi:hypothetical protein